LVAEEALRELHKLGDPAARAGMARFGIRSPNVLGISVPKLRAMARRIGRDQALAEQLWRTSILEARLVAAFIAEPHCITESLMETWANDFDSWAICDGCCCDLFDKTRFAWRKAMEWSSRGVRVNSISPGYTATPMNLRPEVAEQVKQFEADTPLGRMATVDELVGPAVFLLSQASSFCTGVDLVVDGGFVCW